MAKSEWSFATATELSEALAAEKVSAVELAQDAIARIERHDGKINAICVRDFERGLEAARAADTARARGETRPLLGIPLTVKESYNVAGLPTTWGFPPQKDFVPPEDALSISRVKAAGGVIIGKTNVPVGLADWQSYNEIYGTTNNPFDLGRTPGGSSGGSAAALAAGYGPLSLGTDIGGSLRVPAFHCGVYAHKPTYNMVPMRGHTPPPFPPLPLDRDMAVIGPMARSAVDLSLLLDVMAGPDPLEAGVAYRLALPPPRHNQLKSFRVLVIDSDPILPVNKEIRDAIEKLVGSLARSGVSVSRQSPLLPNFAETSRLYMRMLMSFLGAFLAPDVIAGAQERAAKLTPEDRSLAAELRCGDLPCDADASVSARSLAGAGNAPHQYRRQGLRLPRSVGVARHRYATRLAGHRDPDWTFAARPAGRRADRRPMAGRPHASAVGRTDRA